MRLRKNTWKEGVVFQIGRLVGRKEARRTGMKRKKLRYMSTVLEV